MRRVVLAATVAVAIAAGALVLPAPAQATSTDTTSDLGGLSVTRYGGADRYATSLLVAEAVTAHAGGSVDTVVLVSGLSWPDAVVGPEDPVLLAQCVVRSASCRRSSTR